MELLERLQYFDTFTASEKAVIQVIFQTPEILKEATAQELAQAAYTSASTVVRLCRKLDCKNYNDFRVRLTSEMEKRSYKNLLIDANFPFKSTDSAPDILSQITGLEQIALQNTLEHLDLDSYRHAVSMLVQARQIDVYGAGINTHLAYDFAYKMERIHRKVSIGLDHQQQILSACTSGPDHCAIVISYSGETTLTVRYAKALYETKTPILSITSQGENSVSNYAAQKLYIATLEKQFSKIGPFASSLSIMTLLNYLYAGVFAQDYDDNYQKLILTALRTTEFRSHAEPLREDQ